MEKKHLLSLNKAQREAVEYCDGPSLVIAGAGSGKTRVLVHKLVHLINIGYAPSSLMALTFTNKAANQMRERIYKEVGEKARFIRMGTFHSIFARILREHAENIGYSSNFSIYDSNDSKSRIKAIIKEMELDDKKYTPNSVQSIISRAKNNLILPQAYMNNKDIVKLDNKNGIPELGQIYLKYFSSLRQNNALDFDDLLLYTNILFRDYPDILAIWQDRLDYLLIDEYQDTNLAQYMIARKLVETKGRIFVVGDDAQSIYSFRGANIENILNFPSRFENTRVFKLEENYRSTQNIVKAANAIIRNNSSQHPKEIFSSNEVGDKIEIYRAATGELEAGWLVQQIEKLKYSHNIPYSHFAVLYRNNSQSRILEQTFRRSSIPFRIWGGMSFFSYKEIVDIMSYFRVVVNEQDDAALLRIINYPKRGIGDTSINKVRTIASENNMNIMSILRNADMMATTGISKGTINRIDNFVELIDIMREKSQSQELSLYDIVNSIIHSSGIYHELMQDNSSEGKQRQDNMQELISSVDDYVNTANEQNEYPSLAGYLEEISLYTDTQGKQKDDTPSVTLMTIHSAKGLEFPHVFIVGVEENTFPSILSIKSPKDIEEERRLMYVAITRAEKTCHISYAQERFKYGRVENTKPSRFLRELPEELIETSSDSVLHEIKNRGAASLPSSSEFKKKVQEAMKASINRNSNRKVFISRRESNAVPEETYESIGNLSIGDLVSHKVFGKGTIKQLEGRDSDAKAIVDFELHGAKKLLLRFAKLNKLNK